MLRYAGDTHHPRLASRTEDAGQTWSEPYPLEPANPNSSTAAAVGTVDDGLLVALNDLQDGTSSSASTAPTPGSVWRTVAQLDQSPDPLGQPFSPEAYKAIIGEGFRASSGCSSAHPWKSAFSAWIAAYANPVGAISSTSTPYFSRSPDGMYHLVYSWNNTFIKHVSFNEAWLEERL